MSWYPTHVMKTWSLTIRLLYWGGTYRIEMSVVPLPFWTSGGGGRGLSCPPQKSNSDTSDAQSVAKITIVTDLSRLLLWLLHIQKTLHNNSPPLFAGLCSKGNRVSANSSSHNTACSYLVAFHFLILTQVKLNKVYKWIFDFSYTVLLLLTNSW
jgi:hypothetical protein